MREDLRGDWQGYARFAGKEKNTVPRAGLSWSAGGGAGLRRGLSPSEEVDYLRNDSNIKAKGVGKKIALKRLMSSQVRSLRVGLN